MKLKREEQWENLTLGNDFIFGKVMENPKLCKTMLERLLKLRIRKLEYPERQKSIEITLAGKGIRLDIYVEDDENIVYNVEIQRINTKEVDIIKDYLIYK